jgi:shikimate 5-dehydrogenase
MKFALIGHPVAGSLSPRLIAAAYDGAHTYDLLDFERFEDAWEAFVNGYDGINVTAPFKQDAFRKVDVLSPKAQATGAVNLVVRCPQGFEGHNTDVDGVILALQETGLPLADALVVGTGGAARAAVHAAQLLGCRVTVTGRSPAKAAALGCPAVPLEEASALSPDVIIYTLPGSAPVPEGLPFAGAVVLEAEYRIPQLEGVPCRKYVSGRRWMLGQAAAGYGIFTGVAPSLEKMAKVL